MSNKLSDGFWDIGVATYECGRLAFTGDPINIDPGVLAEKIFKAIYNREAKSRADFSQLVDFVGGYFDAKGVVTKEKEM